MSEDKSSFQEQLQDFMEAAQRPEAPLTPSEIRKVRIMQDEYDKAAWLKKKVLVYAPHIAAFFAGVWGLWTWLGANFGGPK